jgi:thioredoxin-like negative regulator of GroEL
MIWFYRDGCKFCDYMAKDWIEFEESKPYYVEVKKVNIREEPMMAYEFGVNGVPHIVKVVDGQIYVFNGDRTVENFLQFAIE